jgi:hypothetical protein
VPKSSEQISRRLQDMCLHYLKFSEPSSFEHRENELLCQSNFVILSFCDTIYVGFVFFFLCVYFAFGSIIIFWNSSINFRKCKHTFCEHPYIYFEILLTCKFAFYVVVSWFQVRYLDKKGDTKGKKKCHAA